jgi:hypothetical protein
VVPGVVLAGRRAAVARNLSFRWFPAQRYACEYPACRRGGLRAGYRG